MSKPYTESDFSAQITADRNWRIKEISDLKAAIRRGDDSLQKVLLRALITISYAHWEGYIRFSSKKYLEHVALRSHKYGELDRQFLKNYFLPRLNAFSNTKINLKDQCNLIDEILNSSNKQFRRMNEELINTGGNLKFEVLSDICLICGISIELFSDKSTFIDTILLKRRNSIAHGENAFISISDMDQIADITIELMRAFGDALENHVYMKTYKSS